MTRKTTYILLVSLLILYQWRLCAQEKYDLSSLFLKREITVVITDSGLGGLSVMEDIAIKMKESGCFQKVNLIFVNALFDINSGYNSLQTKKEKTDMLDSVLTAIDENYHPDAILIACNTLSVIYSETDFSKSTDTPVIGIVEAGVEMIRKGLEDDPASRVIIFGTETTIEENSHMNALLTLNFSGKRIFTKACPQLQSYIEQDPSSEETEMLISVYMNEALEQIEDTAGIVYVSLNCSHFGYSEELWAKAIDNSYYRSGGILNPNYLMGNVLTDEKYKNRYTDTKISFLVVSKIELSNTDSMSGLFRETSPELAKALKNYSLIPGLF
jgi:glutamate racemase